MKSSVIRAAIVTSLVTALVVSGLAFYVGPRLMNPASPTEGVTLQPAVYNGDQQIGAQQPAYSNAATNPTPRLSKRPAAVSRASYPAATNSSATYNGEPVRKHRSTAKSVAIVAGSAGAGAAIGALAGGGKGAGIGAIAGGVGGLIYDRLTANK